MNKNCDNETSFFNNRKKKENKSKPCRIRSGVECDLKGQDFFAFSLMDENSDNETKNRKKILIENESKPSQNLI